MMNYQEFETRVINEVSSRICQESWYHGVCIEHMKSAYQSYIACGGSIDQLNACIDAIQGDTEYYDNPAVTAR